MTLEFNWQYIKLRDDDIATVYRDEQNGVTGALYIDPFHGTVSIEIGAATVLGDLSTAERRAHAVLAMCEWMRKVQKGEV